MVKVKRATPRKICFTPNINPYAFGSVLAEFGNTKVHVTVMIQESVPPFLKGKGKGWLTAEYSMLPASSQTRIERERKGASGRTQEIQRLIGRSLRSIIDLDKIGERTITIDCDVLVADGGTRTTAISGAYVALKIATNKMIEKKMISTNPIKTALAAISVGINKDEEVVVDLNYEEDSSCETDMNIVMTKEGKFVELQGTAEGNPFSYEHLEQILKSAKTALEVVFNEQMKALV